MWKPLVQDGKAMWAVGNVTLPVSSEKGTKWKQANAAWVSPLHGWWRRRSLEAFKVFKTHRKWQKTPLKLKKKLQNEALGLISLSHILYGRDFLMFIIKSPLMHNVKASGLLMDGVIGHWRWAHAWVWIPMQPRWRLSGNHVDLT